MLFFSCCWYCRSRTFPSSEFYWVSSVRVGEYQAGVRFALNPGSLWCYWSERGRQTIVSLARLGGTLCAVM